MKRRSLFFALLFLSTAELASASERPQHPETSKILSLLGERADQAYAPKILPKGVPPVGALIRLPRGVEAKALGAVEVSPGVARLRASARTLLEITSRNPSLALEVSPPVHVLLHKAGEWTRGAAARARTGLTGKGVYVGIADTGIDVSHPDFRLANGRTRIAWLLDFSLKPLGRYPELEEKYGLRDEAGALVAGAVLASREINQLLSQNADVIPHDEVGHGTHVASLAAGNGGLLSGYESPYVGMAPGADIVFTRVTSGGSEAIGNDALAAGVGFMFERADEAQKPIVVNLSLGTEFGPHDGSMLWEEALASYVGGDKPGHILIVAAGNSGSVADNRSHQSVYVPDGTTLKVPIRTRGASAGGVQVWVTTHAGSALSIGLEGPDGEWIAPVSDGEALGKNTADYRAAVIHGNTGDSPIPKGSRGAAIVWQGKWPEGIYNVVLTGKGSAELYIQPLGDAQGTSSFVYGVREGTVNLPATHPRIIAVGCTVNAPGWQSKAGGKVTLAVPLLDAEGGLARRGELGPDAVEGDVCWFSSAGPTAVGVPKPDITAPGAPIVGAMAAQAPPSSPISIFHNPRCPPIDKTKPSDPPDPACLQVDVSHAVAMGTSMSAPIVSGAVALLLERDPTLTQDKILALLQAGAHRFRTPVRFSDQSGPGELDVEGSLAALLEMQNPSLYLPSTKESWVATSADSIAADGSVPLTAIYELRTEDGAHRADGFDRPRFVPYATMAGEILPTKEPVRRGPGVWVMEIPIPAGRGGDRITVGARFDGADVVAPRVVRIATDAWSAKYASRVKGGCQMGVHHGGGLIPSLCSPLALLLLCLRRRVRLSARPKIQTTPVRERRRWSRQ